MFILSIIHIIKSIPKNNNNHYENNCYDKYEACRIYQKTRMEMFSLTLRLYGKGRQLSRDAYGT